MARAAVGDVIQDLLDEFSEAQKSYQNIQDRKEDMDILTGLHTSPEGDPCSLGDLTAEKPIQVTHNIFALRTTIDDCEAKGREQVERVLYELDAEVMKGKSIDSFERQKQFEDHRNQQLDEILEEKHVLQFIQDGAERSRVLLDYADLTEEKLDLMTEEQKDVHYSKVRADRIQQRYAVGIKVAEKLQMDLPMEHRNIDEKSQSLADLDQNAATAQEARYSANSEVMRVRKQLQMEIEKGKKCDAKRGEAFMKHKAAMEKFLKLKEEMSTALIMVLDTAIECEAHDQHEMRLAESAASAQAELENATKACDEANKAYDKLEEQVTQGRDEIRRRVEEKQKDLLSHSTPYVKEYMKNIALSLELFDRIEKEKKKEVKYLQKERDTAAAAASALSSIQRGKKAQLELACKNEEVAKCRDLIECRRQELEELKEKRGLAREHYEFCLHLQLHNPRLEQEEATRFAQAEAERCLGRFTLWVQDPTLESLEAEMSPKSPKENCAAHHRGLRQAYPQLGGQRLGSPFLSFGQLSRSPRSEASSAYSERTERTAPSEADDDSPDLDTSATLEAPGPGGLPGRPDNPSLMRKAPKEGAASSLTASLGASRAPKLPAPWTSRLSTPLQGRSAALASKKPECQVSVEVNESW